MRNKQGFDVAVGPCRALLRFLGIWPDPVIPENLFNMIQFIVVILTMFIFGNVAQTTMVIKVWGDLNAVIEILTTANIPIFCSLIKYFAAWYYRKLLKGLVTLMTEDWRQPYTECDIQAMWANARFSRKLSLVCICLAEGTVTAQFIMVVAFGVNKKSQTHLKRALYMTSYFPYDTQSSPSYEITWIGQLFSNVFGGSVFSSIDALFAVLVMHLCAQLSVLRRALEELINEDKNGKEKFALKLAEIVRRHDHLNRFASTIEDSFNAMFLPQMIVSSFALCLQGYQLIMILNDAEDGLPVFQLIHMMYYTTCFSFSLFVYCYVAEQLLYESTEIVSAAYRSDWYNLRPKETKLLLLLMHRAQKPLEITAGKFCTFSLELYCSILKTSGGYLSMLLAVRDRLAPDAS